MNWSFFYNTTFFLLVSVSLLAQKKRIDSNTYKGWEDLGIYEVSNDGKYVYYSILKSDTTLLSLCSADGTWRVPINNNGSSQIFTADSRYFVFSEKQRVGIVDLTTHKLSYINGATDCIIPNGGGGRWLSYRIDTNIVLHDFKTGRTENYINSRESFFFGDGTAVVLRTANSLLWIDLPGKKVKEFYRGIEPRNIVLNAQYKSLIFQVADKKSTTIFYYKRDMDSAEVLVSEKQSGAEKRTLISSERAYFSDDGENVFFKLVSRDQVRKTAPDVITPYINIWSYKDTYLQSEQREMIKRLRRQSFTAVISVRNRKIIQIENADTSLHAVSQKYVIVINRTNTSEAFWNDSENPKYQLLSLKDGSKISFANKDHKVLDPQFSPGGHFLTWTDTVSKQYYCYEIATSITRNITVNINSSRNIYTHRQFLPFHFSVCGWLEGDKALLIRDRYDLFQVDPVGRLDPICITGYYGRKNNILLRPLEVQDVLSRKKTSDSLLLVGWMDSCKYNGFLKVKLGTAARPRVIRFDPYVYYFPGIFIDEPPHPVRAKNADVYILQQQSDTVAPNIIVTKDFTDLLQLSDIHPHRDFNWLTSELIYWGAPGGINLKGVLYKPEDFNPTRKYPIIFYYYDVLSDRCYKFWKPDLSAGALNIPTYVSNGYLVFVPDIPKETGHPGDAAIKSVVSAANYLKRKYVWIDSTRMGLQGHSHGGYETNYIITQTNMFAAAQSSAGITDMVSLYGGLGFGSKSLASELVETKFYDLDGRPWDSTETYIKNSPLFFANKIKTPLLMMHNSNDGVVPFGQSLEFFIALRRLKKKVWLLEYDYADHVLMGEKELPDFTIRQQQFFDHYLKGWPAPLWMVEGINAVDKGIKSGLQLDSLNRQP